MQTQPYHCIRVETERKTPYAQFRMDDGKLLGFNKIDDEFYTQFNKDARRAQLFVENKDKSIAHYAMGLEKSKLLPKERVERHEHFLGQQDLSESATKILTYGNYQTAHHQDRYMVKTLIATITPKNKHNSLNYSYKPGHVVTHIQEIEGELIIQTVSSGNVIYSDTNNPEKDFDTEKDIYIVQRCIIDIEEFNKDVEQFKASSTDKVSHDEAVLNTIGKAKMTAYIMVPDNYPNSENMLLSMKNFFNPNKAGKKAAKEKAGLTCKADIIENTISPNIS